jgi:hypothetical protein
LTFAPNGDLYFASTTHETKSKGQDVRSGALVSKSVDGGLTWGPSKTLIAHGTRPVSDKGSITADPTNSAFVYAIWMDQLGSGSEEMFARTTDGGVTWEPARPIYKTPGNEFSYGDGIVVQPNGTLVDLFTHVAKAKDHYDNVLTAHRSTDHGLTWATAVGQVLMLPATVSDPDDTSLVNASGGLADVAVDPHNGNLYAVWNDTRFSPEGFNAIAFTTSTDGGFTWSAPIKINQTPTGIAPANQQAFTPAVAVADDGTVGVTYYDFRFNDPSPGLLTDYWFVHAHPASPGGVTEASNWTDETRLTTQSFDMEKAPNVGAYFVGDYEGLAAQGNDFLALFSQPHGSDMASVFFRRVHP